LLYTDGEEHLRLRAPLEDMEKALPPRTMARMTREVCGSLIGGVAAKGRADLVGGYAMMVPVMVLGRMLGLDLETSRELVLAQIDLVTNSEKAQAGNQRSAEILTSLLHARQAQPADDMTAIFTRHPNFRDDDERMHSLTTTLAAAGQNSMGWIAGTMLLMLTDERFSGQLRGGRLGLDDALDEVLWRDPPLANMPARYAQRDTVLAGQPIQKGDALILGFAAANADPRVHSDDPWNELGNRSHLAWGAGSHKCPAEVPARVIVRTAVETALHQLPGLRLAAAAGELGRIGAPWQHCPATLPVTFTPGVQIRRGTRT
jgi:cytochrome P450